MAETLLNRKLRVTFGVMLHQTNITQIRQALHNMIPAGFELRKADQGTDASDVVRTFRKAQLEGKQLFYFTVPASVPITVIEKMEIPLERAQLGLPIFSHDGEDYGVTLDDAVTSQTIKLMIPHKGGDKYSMRK